MSEISEPSLAAYERLSQRYLNSVEANTFRTRGEPLRLAIRDHATDEVTTTDNWHSVKGGLNHEKHEQGTKIGVNYEVLYNPDSKLWLKVVPAVGDTLGILAPRLKKSVEIGRASLVISGMSDLVPEFKECSVDLQGTEVYGFVSPHLGPSIAWFLHESRGAGSTDSPEEAAFFSEVYGIAYLRAAQLYVENGFWTADPNPGNVLLSRSLEDQWKVLLIDFSNSHQTEDNLFTYAPLPMDRRMRQIYDRLRRLHDTFGRTCSKNKVNFGKELLDQAKKSVLEPGVFNTSK